MVCFSPLKVWRGPKNSKGRSPVVFKASEAVRPDAKLEIPCGKCLGCKLERSRQWAIRCMHESQMHDDNCFITLTYDDEHLPEGGSLRPSDFVKFMKRMRKRYEEKDIRFFQCGEYGEGFSRPHHHAIIFGHDFRNDRNDEVYRSCVGGQELVSSQVLSELWPYGFNTVGDVTYESCCYVARYVTKKIFGKGAFEHYADVDKSSGEIFSRRVPEYITMSRRPGIGRPWYEAFKSDVFPSDSVIVNGRPGKPPKYYDLLLDKDNPLLYTSLKERREGDITQGFKDNNTWERLKVREKVCEARSNLFAKRRFEK